MDQVTNVEHASRAEYVYNELSRAVSDLELAPGTALSENRLARSLNVSRTPVRQALRRLEQEGLVEQVDGGSYTVRGLVDRDVHEICDLLELLDSYVVTSATARFTDEQRVELLGLADDMAAAVAAGDLALWNSIDNSFHALLQVGADNDLVSSLVDQTRRRIHRFWAAGARRERLEACSEEHKEIARAVSQRDAEPAVRLVREHVKHMRASLLDLLAHAAPLLPRHDYQGPGRR